MEFGKKNFPQIIKHLYGRLGHFLSTHQVSAHLETKFFALNFDLAPYFHF